MICTPAIVTLITSFITASLSTFVSFSWVNLILNIMLIPLWVLFLNFLCNKGYNFVAWIFAGMSIFSALVAMIYETFYLTTDKTPVVQASASASASQIQSSPLVQMDTYYPPQDTDDSDGYESN